MSKYNIEILNKLPPEARLILEFFETKEDKSN